MELKLVKDCAPKRLMHQNAQLLNRYETAQCAIEELRNETALMKGHFIALVEASKQVIDEQEQAKLLEQDKKLIEKKD